MTSEERARPRPYGKFLDGWLDWGIRPEPRTGTTTRFAPAPTGRLHLGHLANALFVWGMAKARSGAVLLRLEDHDRQRCRPAFEAALLDDLDRLGITPDEPTTDELRKGSSPYRQSDNFEYYDAAYQYLRTVAEPYVCDCTRTTFSAWRDQHGRAWSGPGCPGSCRSRTIDWRPFLNLRVPLGDEQVSWTDAILGERTGSPSPAGDLLVRDRNGNFTYAMCVVVDDLRHGVDLVVRGEDLVESTPAQIRLGQLLGRIAPPTFAHHPLILNPDGSKLSKADGATSVGDLLDAGASPEFLFGEAAARAGIIEAPRPLSFEAAAELVAAAG